MATLRAQQPWNRKTLTVSMFVLEMANKLKKKVQVELFLPARQCPECKHYSGVFVQPTNKCAPCWSYGALSKIANAGDKAGAMNPEAEHRGEGHQPR